MMHRGVLTGHVFPHAPQFDAFERSSQVSPQAIRLAPQSTAFAAPSSASTEAPPSDASSFVTARPSTDALASAHPSAQALPAYSPIPEIAAHAPSAPTKAVITANRIVQPTIS